jgi:hypothetical protein
MGRYYFSIYPHVSLHLWLFGLELSRPMITNISRLISNHTILKLGLFVLIVYGKYV